MSCEFRIRTRINDADRTAVFDLSLDADLHVRSMAASREHLLDRTGSGLLALGDEVTWRARHFGVWWRMTSRVTEWDRPHRFVDEQVRGPFRAFRHEHRFDQDGDDVVVTDVVTLVAPFGPVGRLVERLGLCTYMRRLIEHRNQAIRHHAEARSR